MPCRNVARQSQKQIRPIGIEPTHPAPEAGALSTELRAQITLNMIPETEQFVKDFLYANFLQNFFIFFEQKFAFWQNLYYNMSMTYKALYANN